MAALVLPCTPKSVSISTLPHNLRRSPTSTNLITQFLDLSYPRHRDVRVRLNISIDRHPALQRSTEILFDRTKRLVQLIGEIERAFGIASTSIGKGAISNSNIVLKIMDSNGRLLLQNSRLGERIFERCRGGQETLSLSVIVSHVR
ncbi:hypothetical protein NEOLI_002628 [Neolecta irregularis DAH-3]|uniref:Uncharacterized protein n=1 Tax=Neolecta irregularis (strain DAH-3) TaxID=1198029 RepID=A0A1U7LQT8_NEOID|nr:hypothetical protein NEOLI_002628 [Neolecta irregularis DAH-3]|eukprot:OLL24881.1 hypothetical protein NEOLI_002628 [Neolecta irregularis DAH-3]